MGNLESTNRRLTPYLSETKRHLKKLRKTVKRGGFEDILKDAPTAVVDPEIVEEAARALKSWRESPEGAAKIEAMKELSFAELTQSLRSIAAEPVFARTFELLSKQRIENVVDDEFHVAKSLSFAFSGSLEFLGGAFGAIGYAVDTSDSSKFSIYVSAGLSFGPDEGGDIGFEIGLWSNPPSDLSGASVGGTAVLVGGVGVSGSLAFGVSLSVVPPHIVPDITNWAVSLTIAAGEEAGGALTGSYTLVVVNETVPPIAQPDASHFARVVSIECVQKQDSSGKDELSFKLQMDGSGDVYPYPTWSHYSIPEGGTWSCGRSVRFNDYFTVILYNGGSELGSITVDWSKLDPQGTTKFGFDYTRNFNQVAYNIYVGVFY